MNTTNKPLDEQLAIAFAEMLGHTLQETEDFEAFAAAFTAAVLAVPYKAATVEGAKTAASMDMRRVVQSSLLPRGQADTTFPSALPTKGCDMFTHRRFVKGAEGGFVGGGVLPRDEFVMSAKPEPQPAPIPAEQQFILDYAALCERSGHCIYTPYESELYVRPTSGLAEYVSRVVLELIGGVNEQWHPTLKTLFLTHAGQHPSAKYETVLNVAKNVSPSELREAIGANNPYYVEYVLSDIGGEARDHVENAPPGTRFSKRMTEWYAYAVENDL